MLLGLLSLEFIDIVYFVFYIRFSIWVSHETWQFQFELIYGILNISRNDNTKKGRLHIGNPRTRIILWLWFPELYMWKKVNVSNKFKDQRPLSNSLATVMFRGTPCILRVHVPQPPPRPLLLIPLHLMLN